MPTKMYHVHGYSEMIHQGTLALEALKELLWEHDDEDWMLAEFELQENAPIRAIISTDVEHARYVWTMVRWVREA